MKMYHAIQWDIKIEEVEVIRKTDSSLWLHRNGREKRVSSTYYYDTYELAKQSYINEINNTISVYERQIEYQKIKLEKVNNL